MKENLPVSYQFEGIVSAWRVFHLSRTHKISSPLMKCESCLTSQVIAFNVNFACLDCGCSATRSLKFRESKGCFFCKCCAAAM